MGVRPCSIACEATTGSAGIPHGHWFESWLFHFHSSSLLKHLGKKERTVQVLGFLLLS